MLTTRCPHCATIFEVLVEQLRLRDGLVRCGQCARVFNAKACLLEPLPERPIVMPLVATSPAITPTAVTPPAVLRHRASRVVWGLKQQTDPDPGCEDDGGGDGDDRDAQGKHDDHGDEAAPVIMAEPNPYVYARAVPEFMDERTETQNAWARPLWGAAALLAMLVLVGQSLLTFRLAVVTAVPALRPVLQALCQPLDCVVGYERRAERLAITASSLQPASARAENGSVRLVLAVTLRNRYLHPQSWPALMLDLRDFSDTVVMRRALLPAEYLSQAMAAQPLGAGAEVALSIPLTVTDTPISGYQVRAFYP